MEENKVITIEEAKRADMPSYEELLILKGRVDAFVNYVNTFDYSISPKTCVAMLGYEYRGKDDER